MKATEIAASMLAQEPFLADLDPRYVEQIAECAFHAEFDAGEYIFNEGGAANRFYIISKGQVAVEVHRPGTNPLVVQTVGERQALGWSWLFPPYRWHFDTRALTDIEAIAFDAMCLRGKCDGDHDLGYEMMRRFTQVLMQRMQATMLQVMDVYGVPA